MHRRKGWRADAGAAWLTWALRRRLVEAAGAPTDRRAELSRSWLVAHQRLAMLRPAPSWSQHGKLLMCHEPGTGRLGTSLSRCAGSQDQTPAGCPGQPCCTCICTTAVQLLHRASGLRCKRSRAPAGSALPVAQVQGRRRSRRSGSTRARCTRRSTSPRCTPPPWPGCQRSWCGAHLRAAQSPPWGPCQDMIALARIGMPGHHAGRALDERPPDRRSGATAMRLTRQA